MLKIHQILVIGLWAMGAVALPACGQRGDLFLPNPPPGTERASLTQALKPASPAASSGPAAHSPVKP